MDRYKKIIRILLWTWAANWLLAGIKIVLGIFTRCSSILADGFHSLSDGASNFIGIIGIGIAKRPIDKNHPYGHKKYETLASLGIAAMLFLLAFTLIKTAIQRFFHPTIIPQIDIITFVFMVTGLATNIAVMTYEYRLGRRLSSDVLISDSLHTRADIFTTLSVIFTLLLLKRGLMLADLITTIIIALFILASGYKIAQGALRILSDAVAIVDTAALSDTILSVEGVKSCHKIRSRGRPDDVHVDVHVQLDPKTKIEEAHRISYAVENKIKTTFPFITDIVVHMEPTTKKQSLEESKDNKSAKKAGNNKTKKDICA